MSSAPRGSPPGKEFKTSSIRTKIVPAPAKTPSTSDTKPVKPIALKATPSTPAPAPAPIPSAPTTSKAKRKRETIPEEVGAWTAVKKARLLEAIISAGYRASDFGVLAEELGVSRQQITNQLAPGRSNLRSGAIKWALGEK